MVLTKFIAIAAGAGLGFAVAGKEGAAAGAALAMGGVAMVGDGPDADEARGPPIVANPRPAAGSLPAAAANSSAAAFNPAPPEGHGVVSAAATPSAAAADSPAAHPDDAGEERDAPKAKRKKRRSPQPQPPLSSVLEDDGKQAGQAAAAPGGVGRDSDRKTFVRKSRAETDRERAEDRRAMAEAEDLLAAPAANSPSPENPYPASGSNLATPAVTVSAAAISATLPTASAAAASAPTSAAAAAADDDDWQDGGPKRKKKSKEEQARDKAVRFAAAQNAAKGLVPKTGGRATCVFLASDLSVIATGHSSGLAKDGLSRSADATVDTRLGAKSQKKGFGGKACAEPHAAVKAGNRLSNVAYSLAYHVENGTYLPACGDCSRLLEKYSIKDLYSASLNK